MKKFIVIFLGIILTGTVMAAAEQAVMKAGKLVNDTDLYTEPQHQSEIITELSQDDDVNIATRQRAWYQVLTADQQNGWVKMLDVRFVGAMKRQGELGVKSVFDSVFNQQVAPTASTGIRGFDEEDLKSAQADAAQLTLLSTFQLDEKVAQEFAITGNIVANLSIQTDLDDGEE